MENFSGQLKKYKVTINDLLAENEKWRNEPEPAKASVTREYFITDDTIKLLKAYS